MWPVYVVIQSIRSEEGENNWAKALFILKLWRFRRMENVSVIDPEENLNNFFLVRLILCICILRECLFDLFQLE